MNAYKKNYLAIVVFSVAAVYFLADAIIRQTWMTLPGILFCVFYILRISRVNFNKWYFEVFGLIFLTVLVTVICYHLLTGEGGLDILEAAIIVVAIVFWGMIAKSFLDKWKTNSKENNS